MLRTYQQHVEERAKKNLLPLPLNVEKVAGLVELLITDSQAHEAY